MIPLASFLQDSDFINSCYIVAFILFIVGLHLLNHPRTARRGNRLAAVGMAVAVIATLLIGEAHDTFDKVILTIAIIFGTINVVGGFLVTDRMLEMFKARPTSAPKKEDAE